VKIRLKPVQEKFAAALLILGAAIFPFSRCTNANTLIHARVVDSQAGGERVVREQSSDSRPTKQNVRPGEPTPPAPLANDRKIDAEPANYSYEFSQPAFHIRHIVIEHDANGIGKITFERLNEEVSLTERLELSPTVLGRISALWRSLLFLESNEDYQAIKQFPHLGTMRISMQQGDRKRTAEFNWTTKPEASALVAEYRRVADQAIFVFDVSVARENQPLNAPKLMEYFESSLKRNWFADPQQLIPLLKEVSTDEHLPLIARNHALRLLKKIEK
jgi:hypothetical protein